MTEKWTKWEPAQGLASNYYIDEILTEVERTIYTPPKPVEDLSKEPEYLRELISKSLLSEESSNEFYILLTNANNRKNRILMTFGHPSSYRCTAKKYRPGLKSELEKEYGTSFLDWTFFKVENSLYLNWLIDQSYEMIGKSSTQFTFFANNLTVDVVTVGEPTIRLIND